MRKLLFLAISFTFTWPSFSQKKDSVTAPASSLSQIESELRGLQQKLFFSKKESERFETNKLFIKLWESALSKPSSLEYAFDSIKEVSRLVSHDKNFRIITWNVPKNDGTHAYFGFIQVNNVKITKKGWFKKTTSTVYEYFSLQDKSATVKNPETYLGDNTKWFGMLYYGIVECDGYYTLLGWDGNDNLTQKKFIDILYFKNDGTPLFGKDVFRIPRKSPKRMVFEYSSEVAMSLKYNDKSNRIVFSHLAPREEGPQMEGQFQYYGPDGSFDSFEQSKGRWILLEDIDARNAKNKNDNREKPDPNKENKMYKPK